MGNVVWSYSSVDLFKLCPHKYYRLRIKKDVSDPPSDATALGVKVHKMAEDYMRDGTALPDTFKHLEPPLARLRAYEGDKFCEYKMGLTKNLEPCDFKDKHVWWRGIPDLLIINKDQARVVDYKTGKSAKFANTKQLEILSLAVFKHFPEVKKIKAALLFLVSKEFVPVEYEKETAQIRWTSWIDDVSKLEKSIELDVWNPKQNFTCKKYCPVLDCVYNGR